MMRSSSATTTLFGAGLILVPLKFRNESVHVAAVPRASKRPVIKRASVLMPRVERALDVVSLHAVSP